GFTLWHYKAETLTQPAAAGFFADAADLMVPGDMVMLSAPDGGRIAAIAGAGKAIALNALA
ncbi:MAG: hypothetical protein POH28_10040, partial [Acidocella sp.]|nr:hypothetical protein [Acidocella sp.]